MAYVVVLDLFLNKGLIHIVYIAQHSISTFKRGDEVTGLSDDRIKALLASGAIAEPQEVEVVESESDKLKKAKQQATDLKKQVDALQAQVDQLTAENAELVKASAAKTDVAATKNAAS